MCSQKELLQARQDTYRGISFEDYGKIAASIRFKKVLEIPYQGHPYGAKEPELQHFQVWWRDDGIVLVVDQYGDRINVAHMYFNFKIGGDEPNKPSRVNGCFWGYPDYNEPDWEKDHKRFKDSGDWVMIASQSVLQALVNKIQRLEEQGTFLREWKSADHLRLWSLKDKYEKGGEREYTTERALELTRERLAMLPEHVRRGILSGKGPGEGCGHNRPDPKD